MLHLFKWKRNKWGQRKRNPAFKISQHFTPFSPHRPHLLISGLSKASVWAFNLVTAMNFHGSPRGLWTRGISRVFFADGARRALGGQRGRGRPLPCAGVGEAKLNFKQWKRAENSTCLGWRGEDGLLPHLSSISLWWLFLAGFRFRRYNPTRLP